MFLHPHALIARCEPSSAQDSAEWRYRSRVEERSVAICARRRAGGERPGITGRERTGSRIARLSERGRVAARRFGSGGRLSQFHVGRAASAIPAAILCRDGSAFRVGSPATSPCPRQVASRRRGIEKLARVFPFIQQEGLQASRSGHEFPPPVVALWRRRMKMLTPAAPAASAASGISQTASWPPPSFGARRM